MEKSPCYHCDFLGLVDPQRLQQIQFLHAVSVLESHCLRLAPLFPQMHEQQLTLKTRVVRMQALWWCPRAGAAR